MQYSVFGGSLQSQVPLPELREVDGGWVDWTLDRVDSAPPATTLESIGEDSLTEDIHVRAHRLAEGFRLQYDDSGAFDITENGTHITWFPGSDASIASVRHDIIGRVMALSLHAAGVLTLHGSAVTIGDEGIAILAPRGTGKSTLALALTFAGARLLTDDTIPVDATLPTLVWPGVHAVRLCKDTVARMPVDWKHRTEPRDKFTFLGLRDDQIMKERVPLSAIYILQPVPASDDSPAAKRTQLSDLHATMAVVCHTKLGRLLGQDEAAVLFDRAVAVAQTVPVYDLNLVRDLDRMDEAVARIMSWHKPVAIDAQAVEFIEAFA